MSGTKYLQMEWGPAVAFWEILLFYNLLASGDLSEWSTHQQAWRLSIDELLWQFLLSLQSSSLGKQQTFQRIQNLYLISTNVCYWSIIFLSKISLISKDSQIKTNSFVKKDPVFKILWLNYLCKHSKNSVEPYKFF